MHKICDILSFKFFFFNISSLIESPTQNGIPEFFVRSKQEIYHNNGEYFCLCIVN